MSDNKELFILRQICDYFDMMFCEYEDSIGEDDYILTKVRFYNEMIDKINEYSAWLESV